MIAPEIASPAVTRHILKAFGLRASKRLGQNFLVDAGVVRAIVDAADLSPADTVLEIGPGIGSQIAADFPQTADALVRAARVSM